MEANRSIHLCQEKALVYEFSRTKTTACSDLTVQQFAEKLKKPCEKVNTRWYVIIQSCKTILNKHRIVISHFPVFIFC